MSFPPRRSEGRIHRWRSVRSAKGAPKRGYTRQTKTTFEVLRLLYVSFALMRTQANKYFVSAGSSGAVPENYEVVLLSNMGKKKPELPKADPSVGMDIPILQVLMGNSGRWTDSILTSNGNAFSGIWTVRLRIRARAL